MTPPFLTSDALTVPHGFFGRKGGVSTGTYESLNAGLRSDDERENVEENRKRIREALNADYMVSLHQVHSDRVVIATDEPVGDMEADGLVTTVPRLAITAMGADCGMVLLSDPKAGVVGACHAGWRGALGGIVEATVATMCELGASPADISATLGPCIGPEKYEVGEEFRSEFLAMDEEYARFFHTPTDAKPHFDLPAFILSRLNVMGVRGNWIGGCTYAQPETYFSYRRNTHQGIEGYGRNLSAIMLA
ncbi:peptidoglycan editing factor PgeF [Litorimonas sp. WD9-15]|uniref:peptidoglycan editing factor PgeF n=1 Tax=Litorimonas sp. WD9-15 TaxID=3418716 RepID=UPI003CFC6E41